MRRTRGDSRLVRHGLAGALVFSVWSSPGADPQPAPLPKWDRAEALRTCKMALSETHHLITTYDVSSTELTGQPGIMRVSGGVLVHAEYDAAEPYRYRCDYDTENGDVVAIELLPAGRTSTETLAL